MQVSLYLLHVTILNLAGRQDKIKLDFNSDSLPSLYFINADSSSPGSFHAVFFYVRPSRRRSDFPDSSELDFFGDMSDRHSLHQLPELFGFLNRHVKHFFQIIKINPLFTHLLQSANLVVVSYGYRKF